ncbi:MAG: hypothetical protein Fur0028_02410 [Bacteroidales bacterium]
MKNTLILTVYLFCCLSIATAQNVSEIVTDSEGNKMLPTKTGKINIETFYDENFTKSLPENTVKLYEKTFNQLIAAFSDNPLFNLPKGFDIQIDKRITVWEKEYKPAEFNTSNESKVVGEIQLSLAPYFYINDKAVTDFHIASIFYIHINNPYNIAGTPLMADIYACPQVVDYFYGYPVYATNREEVTIINFSEKPLFLPVTQEDFINTLINYWEYKIAAVNKEQGNLQNTKDEFYSDEAKKQRDAEFTKAYNELLKYDKNAAEELKKNYEESLHNLSNSSNNETDLNVFEKEQIERLKEELQNMSTTERQRQGYYSLEAMERFNNVSGLLPKEYIKSGDALVRINPALVNDNPDNIQLVSIHWYMMNEEFSDVPRKLNYSDDASLLTDNIILDLYKDKTFWTDIFKLLQTINK